MPTLFKSTMPGRGNTSNNQFENVLQSTGLFNKSAQPLSMTRQLKMMKGNRAKHRLLVIDPEEA